MNGSIGIVSFDEIVLLVVSLVVIVVPITRPSAELSFWQLASIKIEQIEHKFKKVLSIGEFVY